MPLSTAVNLPTVAIGLIIAVIFIVIVVRGIQKRRRGEGGCGCGCSGCPNRDLCRKAGPKRK